jgi:hypothetical protein
LRFCVVDYRALNAITQRRNFPLPRIDELLDRLAGAKFFMSVDLTKPLQLLPCLNFIAVSVQQSLLEAKLLHNKSDLLLN